MEILIAVAVAALSGGVIGNLLGWKKTSSETNSNNVSAANDVLEMMKIQHEEQKAWYEIRLSWQSDEIKDLRGEILELKKELSKIKDGNK